MKKLPMCSFLGNTQTGASSIDSPLQLKLINYLGLKKYMMDNFIFKRKPSSKYAIIKSISFARKMESIPCSPKPNFKLPRATPTRQKYYKPRIIAYPFSD